MHVATHGVVAPGITFSPAVADPELWATVAGPLLRIAPLKSLAVYFPCGHAEQVQQTTLSLLFYTDYRTD